MNPVLKKIETISDDAIDNYLIDVDRTMLEENGMLYYMNDIDGTVFDCKMNNRLCEFMAFYDDSKMGAIKINVLLDGTINIYLCRDNAKSCFKEYQKRISEEESLELAVLMYNIADKENLFAKSISSMNSDLLLTEQLFSEFKKAIK